ncbi:7TM diverse intracellular signaling domain-containing protein [Saccharospirillum sp. HFRX-1]|uniref:hybrid sensor histidine kinase/response regulator n=1 Tax=unclassified Saccharospirillum TaxID=2633430 RepID=UPI003712D0A2
MSFRQPLLLLLAVLLPSWLHAADGLESILLESDQSIDLGTEVIVLADDSGQLSPFDVLSDAYDEQWRTTTSRELQHNYRFGVVWVLFRLDASRSIYKEWDLVIANPSLKYIDLYQLFDTSGPRLVHRTGAMRPFDSRAKDHRYFVLPLEVYGPTTFLMRIDATSNSHLAMTLHPGETFWSTVQLEDFGNWLFYGVILAMVTYNLFLFLTVRDSSYLWYVLFIGFFGAIQFSLDGYMFQYFWWQGQGYDTRLNYLLSGLTLAFAGCFIVKFLDLPRVSSGLTLFVVVAIAFQLILAALAWYLDRALMGLLLTIDSFLYLTMAMLVGIYAWYKGVMAAKYFVLAWAVFYLGNVIFLLASSGLIFLPWPAILVSKLGAFLETMLLSFALAHRIRLLRESSERERMRAEAQSYFLAQISHEIRTPLNGVLGMTEVLARTRLDDEQLSYVHTIQGSGASLMSLINDILDYSKIEAGKMSLNLEFTNIRSLIDQQTQLFCAQAERKRITLQSEVDDSVPDEVQIDVQRLRQVLSNLVSNAIKFTDAGSVRIKVSCEWRQGSHWLQCRIIDTGIGIAASELESLFNAYSQIHADHDRADYGTGLGLAISRQLVQLMGGELNVTSQLGQGSEFQLLVPLQSERIRENIVEENPSHAVSRQLSVLVAEDNVVNQRVIRGLLEKLGHKTIMATNGDEIVSIRQQSDRPADLILMDCEMPEMDGYQATRLIREYEQKHHKSRLPIIALTAHALEEIRQRCLDAGMDDFLTKPVSTRQLEKVLSRYS